MSVADDPIERVLTFVGESEKKSSQYLCGAAGGLIGLLLGWKWAFVLAMAPAVGSMIVALILALVGLLFYRGLSWFLRRAAYRRARELLRGELKIAETRGAKRRVNRFHRALAALDRFWIGADLGAELRELTEFDDDASDGLDPHAEEVEAYREGLRAIEAGARQARRTQQLAATKAAADAELEKQKETLIALRDLEKTSGKLLAQNLRIATGMEMLRDDGRIDSKVEKGQPLSAEEAKKAETALKEHLAEQEAQEALEHIQQLKRQPS